jgi:hypothetical protein
MVFKPAMPRPVPTLILRGACDFLPDSNAVLFAKLFGTSVTTIANSGHGMLENRTDIEAALTRFATEALGEVD